MFIVVSANRAPILEWILGVSGSVRLTTRERRIRERPAFATGVLTVPPGKHQKQDAICFGLEHCLGEVVDVFQPYVRTEEGTFQFDDIFAAKRTSQFFCQLPRG